ncbi:CDP-alcohol phosphatidyltransferase family protein [Robertkochia solimangrovi]|uniref:CDP-alcohol phosphatidyltransferase family protein n=1 Tax=Robertkochia solimangrovi TaxID=2213046 RepID=UPI001180352B|nr:CDP-alcohol phosphatidyltransferase family protein [Robertkochia solimangrovi]TRZ42823.1 phosphatidylserine synthase [Robertkochia solimangrovi]
MKRHIPNFLTMLNLLSGCIAVVLAVRNHLELAALFVAIGIFFDFFDGLAARLLNVKSELGVQLDSLADLVTSGLVPGIVMFQLFNQANGLNSYTWSGESTESMFWVGDTFIAISFLGFLITLASAYRLAKFNIDEDQATTFTGLPTPANALFILSLPLILKYHNNVTFDTLILSNWFLVVITLLSAYMLNARVRLFSLKFKGGKLRDNIIKYTFLLLSLILLIVMQFMAIPVIIVLYVVFSVIENSKGKLA